MVDYPALPNSDIFPATASAPAPSVPRPAVTVISITSANAGWTPGDRVEVEEVATASFAAAANTSCNYAPMSVDVDVVVDVDAAVRLQ